jgi:hypothetical protein
MATDNDVPEASKADAMEVDTENEFAGEKQRLRLVNLLPALTKFLGVKLWRRSSDVLTTSDRYS